MFRLSRYIKLNNKRMRVFSIKVNTNVMNELKEVTSIPDTPSWSIEEYYIKKNSENPIVTDETLIKLAIQSGLRLKKEEIPQRKKELETILQCCQQIKEMAKSLKTQESLEEIQSKDRRFAPLREDVITEGNNLENILKNAKETKGNFFVVPKLCDDG